MSTVLVLSGAVEPAPDFRFSADYRRQLIKVWVKRCLHEILDAKEAR